MSWLETQRIDADGVTLSVTLRGEGTPLLLLHGFTGGGNSLGSVVGLFAAHHRTIAPDLIGHGRSDAPSDVAHYTMQRCITQILAVLDSLEIERADVFGYSMGGRTALALCNAHPERIRRVAIVGASAGLPTASEREARIASDEALAKRIETEGLEAFVSRWAQHPLFASQATRFTTEQQSAIHEQRLNNTSTGLANSLRGMGTGAQPALHEQLGNIQSPVLCLAGEEDAKFRSIASALAAAIPHGQSQRVPDAGHAAHLENPEATARLSLMFFAALEQQQATRKNAASRIQLPVAENS